MFRARIIWEDQASWKQKGPDLDRKEDVVVVHNQRWLFTIFLLQSEFLNSTGEAQWQQALERQDHHA